MVKPITDYPSAAAGFCVNSLRHGTKCSSALSCLLLLMTIVGCGSPAAQLEKAEEALKDQKYDNALELAQSVLAKQSDNAQALFIAAQAAQANQAYEQAVAFLDEIPTSEEAYYLRGTSLAGDLQFDRLSRLSQAEAAFRSALDVDPHYTAALDGLAHLLSVTGRRWESGVYYFELLRRDRNQLGHLIALADLSYFLDDRERLEQCLGAAPLDPLPVLGLACSALSDNRHREALELLRQAVELRPDLIEAQARIAHLWLDDGRLDQLPAWQQNLPEKADRHPSIWTARARWAAISGDRQGSIRCLLEAIRLNPNQESALYQLSQTLAQAGQDALAQACAERARQLMVFIELNQKFQQNQENLDVMYAVAQQAEQLGRLWEAHGWCRAILMRRRDHAEATQLLQQVDVRLSPTQSQTVETAQLASKFDLAEWPLPEYDRLAANQRTRVTAERGQVTFAEEAGDRGIDFQYFNGHDRDERLLYLYAVDGGGVAVLDYDQDGWPDLYFTQGCAWPPSADQTTHLDRLYRNLGNGKFQDVTAQAGLVEPGYGQGVTAGDVNNDGWPDLLVANIGSNRLFINQADGTFAAAGERGTSSPIWPAADAWTASCLIADLNGDGWPDIYEVNYLGGKDVFRRVCSDSQGRPRICPPLTFPAEPDRLLLGNGDGTFRDVSDAAGIREWAGRGLGVVAADLTGSGQLSLFVANDVKDNFLFVNQQSRGQDPRFVEQGLVAGLALDADGRGQACMGVAAADWNGDRLLDLFVTNFHRESNTLYVQQVDGYFLDESRAANLRDASFSMLGFGTQSIDADLDGHPDLVVTNGHLVDESSLGVPFRMRPQLFMNRGDGSFQEVPGSDIGPFFEATRLGRALARWDWNRDGREDCVISHLDTAAALLTNTTQTQHHYLAVRLVGTRSARDAIGAKVTVTCGQHSWQQQLVAGDGYQCRNQQQLLFGLGDHATIDQLQVDWPSGKTTTRHDVPIDQQTTLLEP